MVHAVHAILGWSSVRSEVSSGQQVGAGQRAERHSELRGGAAVAAAVMGRRRGRRRLRAIGAPGGRRSAEGLRWRVLVLMLVLVGRRAGRAGAAGRRAGGVGGRGWLGGRRTGAARAPRTRAPAHALPAARAYAHAHAHTLVQRGRAAPAQAYGHLNTLITICGRLLVAAQTSAEKARSSARKVGATTIVHDMDMTSKEICIIAGVRVIVHACSRSGSDSDERSSEQPSGQPFRGAKNAKRNCIVSVRIKVAGKTDATAPVTCPPGTCHREGRHIESGKRNARIEKKIEISRARPNARTPTPNGKNENITFGLPLSAAALPHACGGGPRRIPGGCARRQLAPLQHTPVSGAERACTRRRRAPVTVLFGEGRASAGAAGGRRACALAAGRASGATTQTRMARRRRSPPLLTTRDQ